jgi:hypothetical protein
MAECLVPNPTAAFRDYKKVGRDIWLTFIKNVKPCEVEYTIRRIHLGKMCKTR